MIIEDELQQQTACVSISNKVSDVVAMSVNKGNNYNQGNQNNKGRRCEQCQYTGHTKENCYRLIGYPADWKHRKRFGFNSRSGQMNSSYGGNGHNYVGEANNLSKENSGEASTSHHEVNNAFVARGHAFTDEEYKQIMDMLGKDKKEVKQVNMTGMANCFSTNIASHCWIIDSGASHHITANEHLLKNSKCMAGSHQDKVNLPTGDKASITHIGDTHLFNNEVIKDVLCVPEFKFNLLSVSQLTRELSCFVTFYPEFCIFQDLYSGRVKGIGKEEGSLYIFRNDSSMKDRCEAQNPQRMVAEVSLQDCELWHRRLGHPSNQVLHGLNLLHDKYTDLLTSCSVCPLAKQTRSSFPISVSKTSKCFELVHMDLWGPYKVRTFDKKYYFLTVVDDYSRYTWLHLLQLKSETIVAIRNFFTLINNQFGCIIKIVRSDNGTEFFNSQCKELFTSLGIIHQSSCPHTPQQNGVVERKHRHILNVARAIRFQSCMPLRFWGICVQAAVYLINRLPSFNLHNKSPYEMMFSKPPNISHLRVIGCLGYASAIPKMTSFQKGQNL